MYFQKTKLKAHVKQVTQFFVMDLLVVSSFALNPMHTFDYGILYDYLGFVWTGLLGGRTAIKKELCERVKLYTECDRPVISYTTLCVFPLTTIVFCRGGEVYHKQFVP